MTMEHNPSWFIALSETFSKIALDVANLLSSCFCITDGECLEEYSNSQQDRRYKGMNVEDRDSMALLAAIFTGRDDRARELLMLPWMNINVQYANGNTPLILAVQGNNDRIVHMLLNHPMINVNQRGLDGYTPLIRACYDRPDFVRSLLSRPETQVNLSTYFGSSALTYAVRNGNTEAVKLLLSITDIDINFQSRFGENAILEAVTYRRNDIVALLLERRDLNVNVVDDKERTPLVMAAQFGYTPLVRLLLTRECDLFCEDERGHNALFYALKRSNYEMVELLMDPSLQNKPQPLTHICRNVIRRFLIINLRKNQRLKHTIHKIPPWELPKSLIRFLAYDP